MLNDPIIEEIHRNRKKIWEDNNGNIAQAMTLNKEKREELKKQGWKFITKEELKTTEFAEHK